MYRMRLPEKQQGLHLSLPSLSDSLIISREQRSMLQWIWCYIRWKRETFHQIIAVVWYGTWDAITFCHHPFVKLWPSWIENSLLHLAKKNLSLKNTFRKFCAPIDDFVIDSTFFPSFIHCSTPHLFSQENMLNLVHVWESNILMDLLISLFFYLTITQQNHILRFTIDLPNTDILFRFSNAQFGSH